MRIRLGVLRRMIREAAVTSQQSGRSGLAMYAMDDLPTVRQVLIYDPALVLERIEAILDQSGAGPIDVDNLFDRARKSTDAQAAIVGMLTLAPPERGECYGAWIVKGSAARSGYGPMVYDLAMGISPNHVLIPDRFSVSNAASGIWNFYSSRRKDVDVMPLDDIDNPKTVTPVDDCEIYRKQNATDYLNSAYRSRADVDSSRLRANHASLVHVIERTLNGTGLAVRGSVRSALEEMLGDLADKMFVFSIGG